MIAWSRSARARSDSCISAILASTSRSPSSLPAAAFSSRARSFIAARSSSVNRSDLLPVAVRLADFWASGMAGSSPARLDGDDLILGSRARPSRGWGRAAARAGAAGGLVVEEAGDQAAQDQGHGEAVGLAPLLEAFMLVGGEAHGHALPGAAGLGAQRRQGDLVA